MVVPQVLIKINATGTLDKYDDCRPSIKRGRSTGNYLHREIICRWTTCSSAGTPSEQTIVHTDFFVCFFLYFNPR